MKRVTVALAALLVLTGCQSSSPGATASPPLSPPVPPPGSFAEGTQPSPGPLVFLQVIDWLGEPLLSETDATFHLTEHCAYLYAPPDEPVLVVWPVRHAWIDPASPSTVQFREPGTGKLVRITDGQRVNLGGYRVGGRGYTYQPEPHPSCPATGHDFAVQEIR